MSYLLSECDQGPGEWKRARAGRLTGSVAANMMREARKKGDESAARRDLRFRLALERITGRPQENEFTAASVRPGAAKEPEALGIVEAKCPKAATHYEYLTTREIPGDYRWQCVHNLWVSGAQWCDFISYDDCWPERLQYLCVRLERNEQEIQAYAASAGRFLAEVSVAVNDTNKLKGAA